uniref:Alcohol dehydrogenase-like C-terminal domain-containing protein n=1 Tax=Salmo trutta TaxID=8032 RepID=A0A673XU65_SALTR
MFLYFFVFCLVCVHLAELLAFVFPLPRQHGRVGIVTGGISGICFETARHMASLGAHVIIGKPTVTQHTVLYRPTSVNVLFLT